MHFCDSADIKIKAGNGGNGCVCFRREKFVPKGGPDGGNGGNGGSVFFEGDGNINTLVAYLSKKHFSADAGENGKGKNMYGQNAQDLVLKVPLGTTVKDAATGRLVGDVTFHGQRILAVRGGMGGKGNAGFVSSVRQAPDFAELGEPGEAYEIHLELKLIAEVAIIGYPNVGKSTLISRISNARPKIADYPFTTLVPNLGVVKVDDVDFMVADIPGLIEGAHEGKGLGIEFLKHIERTKLLVHVLDITHDDLKSEYDKLNKELKLYSAALAKKPQLLVISKTDAAISEIIDEAKKIFAKKKPLFISAVSGAGLQTFLYALKDMVVKYRRSAKMRNEKCEMKNEPKVFRPHLALPDIRNYTVEKEAEGYRVNGRRIEQMAIMTDVGKKGAVYRMYDVWNKIGIRQRLHRLGARTGDKVFIASRVFEFVEE